MIHTVGIIYNRRIAEALPLSRDLQNLLASLGKESWLVEARELQRPDLNPPPLDLVVTLGGDGSILRAARLAAPHRAAVLGVNMGQLGFLAELGPADVLARLPGIVQGEGWVEERMMLRMVVKGHQPLDGLNDAVVTRSTLPRAVRVAVAVDGVHLITYVADGVIVSTPTGSTAYALAMQGAIVQPEMKCLQITPIAPHLTVIGTIVVPAQATVELTYHSDNPGMASVDGQVDVPISDTDLITVTTSPYVARFVRLQPRDYFYKTLVARLSTNITRGLL